jgi:glycosyltransferase involved in cell wall biosynthesis
MILITVLDSSATRGRSDAGRGAIQLHRVEPVRLAAGRPSLLLLSGSCPPDLRARLVVELAGTRVPVARIGSGFRAVIMVPGDLPVGRHLLTVRLMSDAAHPPASAVIEIVSPNSSPVDVPSALRGDHTEALVAICLATYEPPPALFERQIASIRAQQHRRFVCIISDDCSSEDAWRRIKRETSDDYRFIYSRNSRRLGFYRNFEHCLSLVPDDAVYVALADQDDEWQPDKLLTLVSAIEETGTELVFSDMNLVGPDGGILAPTYWSRARNNFTRLDALLLTNTVTGASALFRRRLLRDALPFPPEVVGSFHDHWLACVALATGGIGFVDRPLYDYVQHDSNASGRVSFGGGYEGGLSQIARRFVAAPRERLRSGIANASQSYAEEAVRLELFARGLELRLGDRMSPKDLRTVRRSARVLTSAGSLFWLMQRSARDLGGRGVTLGAENQLLKAIVWHRSQIVSRWIRRAISHVVPD